MAEIRARVLDFLVRYIADNGYSPSIREITTSLGVASTRTVHDALTMLREEGLVDWVDGQPRTLRIVR